VEHYRIVYIISKDKDKNGCDKYRLWCFTNKTLYEITAQVGSVSAFTDVLPFFSPADDT